MKFKLVSFVIIFILFAGHAICQPFKFGIKAGTDIHKITGKSFDEGFNFGYHIGAFAEVKLKSKIGIQPEVYFSQVNVKNGTTGNSLYPDFNTIIKAKLSYLNIPVLLNIRPSKHIALQAGPQFGILFNKNDGFVQNGKDAFKSGDISIAAGLQLNLLKLIVYARYVGGISNMNDIDAKEQWKNHTIHIGVGYSIL